MMSKHGHGDPRRPDGDLVTPVKPFDHRVDPYPREVGPKVGWGHDAVFRPPLPNPPAERVEPLEDSAPNEDAP